MILKGIKMENLENYITRKEARQYFQNIKSIETIFKKNNIEEIYVNNRFYVNKTQVEELSKELNYRLSIRSNPIAMRYKAESDVSQSIKDNSYDLNQIALIMGVSIPHAHNKLREFNAPFQVGKGRKRWYPKEWVNANIKGKK
jgi:hypothetical protein